MELPFSKHIALSDQHGNEMEFDLMAESQEILDSYSEENFKFDGDP
ncbi:hypothetical protein [Reichenbachiella ulvae]|uniref:Uncharacterized protein n=1 Tax=Reichenbachiella ulvae TaxID=2980104 RepID=A0ABT3CZ99_9BACT|nr:hypothetical protein [Reichenbachiella ulvae]MCV9388904.1 hypothetical protein [Reichenbachiella ulvae]